VNDCVLRSTAKVKNFVGVLYGWRHAVAWLRHYTTRRKVADSIPDEVIGVFS
jgi:hypothetical protein